MRISGVAAGRPDIDRWGAWLPWMTWALVTAAAVYFAAHYAPDFPHHDDFALVEPLARPDARTADWFWAPHNEHRVPLPKAVLLAAVALTGHFRAGPVLNAVALSAAAFLALATVRRLRGRVRWTDLLFPLVIVGLGQGEVFLCGFALNLVLGSVLTWASLLLIARDPEPSVTTLVLFTGCLLALPMCGGSGLIVAPPLAGWLAVTGWRAWRRGTPVAAPRVVIPAVGCVLLAALCAAYLSGFRPSEPARPRTGFDRTETITTWLQLVSLGFGGAWVGWAVTGIGLVGAVAAALPRLVRAWARREDRGRVTGLVAVLAALAGLAGAVAAGRASLYPNIGLSQRYVPLATPLVGWVYFVLEVYAPPAARRRAQAGLCVIATVVACQAWGDGLGLGQFIRATGVAFTADVKAGMFPGLLGERYVDSLGGVNPQYMAGRIARLRDAGFRPFCTLPPEPRLTEVDVTPPVSGWSGRCLEVPLRPGFVYAVRLRVTTPVCQPSSTVDLCWGATPPDSHRFTLPDSGRPPHAVFIAWVNREIDSLRLEASPGAAGMTVERVDLVVPQGSR